ncbi:hypothetical protein [Microcystis phage Mel-JY01]
MDIQLVCTFTRDVNLEVTVNEIKNKFEILNNKIFVYSVHNNVDNILLSYNIVLKQYKKFLPNSILVHRKKESNTMYTINALNQLVLKLNNGYADKRYPIKWDNYSDTIILQKYDVLNILPIQFIQVIEV